MGSDGIRACASCHFRAGADPRSINQANPGGANNPDLTVNVGINHQLSAADFPWHLLVRIHDHCGLCRMPFRCGDLGQLQPDTDRTSTTAGQGTLLQVVNFYNRGGDFREHNAQFIDFEIGKFNLTTQELDDLVAFLKALTDERVLYRRAPFDNPQLFVPNGHRVIHGVPAVASDGTADIMIDVPAVGRNGGAPLKGFLKQ